MITVRSIHLYPIKSTAPVPVDTAAVELAGLRHDRRWAVVDGAGQRLNARTHDRLLRVTASPDDAGALDLSADGLTPLRVAVPHDGPRLAVDVTRQPTAVDAGSAAADWFTQLLGETARLVWQDDPAARQMSPQHGGGPGDPLSLADTGPLLLTTESSLAQLDAWIAADHEAQPMAMQRFRPNVVIAGDLEPFAEDTWRHLTIGALDYRFAEHCDRCVITTIDPTTFARGKEPLRTMARHRKWDGATWFGIRIVPVGTGAITVGDEVRPHPVP